MEIRKKENNISNRKIIIIVSILSIIIITLSVLFYLQTQETKKFITEFEQATTEKETVKNELNELLNQYEDLQKDNSNLSEELTKEQEKIKEMLIEIENIKTENASEVAKYKKNIKGLRNILKGYVIKMDSLNRVNKTLVAENNELKSDNQEAEIINENLEQKNKNQSLIIKKVKTIQAVNINISALRKRDKPTKRASKTKKLKVCFTLTKNEFAEQGLNHVYIRIASPDGNILYHSKKDLINYQGKQIVYSAKRSVNYKGEEIQKCLYYKSDKEFEEGAYIVNVYFNGREIGESILELK